MKMPRRLQAIRPLPPARTRETKIKELALLQRAFRESNLKPTTIWSDANSLPDKEVTLRVDRAGTLAGPVPIAGIPFTFRGSHEDASRLHQIPVRRRVRLLRQTDLRSRPPARTNDIRSAPGSPRRQRISPLRRGCRAHRSCVRRAAGACGRVEGATKTLRRGTDADASGSYEREAMPRDVTPRRNHCR